MHFRLSMCAKVEKTQRQSRRMIGNPRLSWHIYIYIWALWKCENRATDHWPWAKWTYMYSHSSRELLMCSNFVVLSAQPKYVRHGIAYCSHPRDVGVQLCIVSHCYQALFEEAATWLCTWFLLGMGLPPNHTCKWLGNLVQVFLKLFLTTSVSKLQFIFTAYLW